MRMNEWKAEEALWESSDPFEKSMISIDAVYCLPNNFDLPKLICFGQLDIFKKVFMREQTEYRTMQKHPL